MRRIVISMLALAGEIDEKTPYIVLDEMAYVHDIRPIHLLTYSFSDILSPGSNSLENFREEIDRQNLHLSIPLNLENLAEAATFVNKDAVWTPSELTDVLNFMADFIEYPHFRPGKNFYGTPTPSRRFSYNACMLYRLLRIKGADISKTCTLLQLAKSVEILYGPPEDSRTILYSEICELEPEELFAVYKSCMQTGKWHNELCEYNPPLVRRTRKRPIDLLVDASGELSPETSSDVSDGMDIDSHWNEMHENPLFEIPTMTATNVEIPLPELGDASPPVLRPRFQGNFIAEPVPLKENLYHSLQRISIVLNNAESVMKRLSPQTNVEAIALAAINYNINISSAKKPMNEYIWLETSPDDYCPKDSGLRKLYDANPFILRMDMFFNPLLPQDLYDENILVKLAVHEGYTVQDLRNENPYSLLQTSYYSETFHYGKHPHIKNEHTLEYEEITSLPSCLIVCYGNVSDSLYAFRYRELAVYFKRERCFKNPADETFFGAASIRKLKNICNLVIKGENESALQEKRDLLESIIFVEIANNILFAKLTEIHDLYIYGELENRECVRTGINLLLEIGMYMRGWEGPGTAYPLEYCPVDDQDMVDVNVNTAIIKFEEFCNEYQYTGDLILDLPLMRFVNGDYMVSKDVEEGLTVRQRLIIVKRGDENESIASCIRLTSNWICSTVHRVCEVLQMDLPFDISLLRNIS